MQLPYLVRLKSTKEPVGIYVTSFDDLTYCIDEFCDPSECEYIGIEFSFGMHFNKCTLDKMDDDDKGYWIVNSVEASSSGQTFFDLDKEQADGWRPIE